MESKRFVPGDSTLIEHIVSYLKAKGIFDEFRHDCLADVDTKSSCQNLSQRVVGFTSKFVGNENWNTDTNKNELRNKLRRQIEESGMLPVGADHVVEQVINPKISLLFLPKIIEVVHQYLKEENEKLSRKQESVSGNVSSDKVAETTDGSFIKGKTPVIDPIADILSFTYSKPKTVFSNNAPKSETPLKKGDNVLKAEKKKEDVNLRTKSLQIKSQIDVQSRIEKKEEDINQAGKNAENQVKSETKENVTQVKNIDVILKVEKPIEEVTSVTENNESSNENVVLDTKIKVEIKESNLKKDMNSEDSDLLSQQNELKDIKIKKELKNEEAIVETQKKVPKDEIKLDKKKEDLKVKEEIASVVENKSTSAHKTSVHSKSNLEVDKSRKIKVPTTHKSHGSLNDQRNSKPKETLISKTEFEKQSKPVSSKSSSKELSSLKSGSSKSIKREKSEEESSRNKTIDPNKPSTSSSKKSSSKPSTSKIENVSSKNKHSLDKTEKEKSSKSQGLKTKINLKALKDEKGNKNNIQNSSSYESSQGSDQDKSHSFSADMHKKQKHYSKHHKKEGSYKSSSIERKTASDVKTSHSTPDSSFSKKHKSEKSIKASLQKKSKETTLSQESAKISSRSNSFGSTSSTSDSSNVCKDSLPSSSEDNSENSIKSQENSTKKKKLSEKDHCSTSNDFPPPPPPPPPPPSDSVVTDSVSSSPDNTTQESESEVESSDASDSDSDDNSSSGSGLNSEAESFDAINVYDILNYFSSSSDFDGYGSSPERNKQQSSASNTSVSSVHTSDLSSFEDEISVEDLSFEDLPQSSDQRIKRKFTVKEAQELLRSREQRRLCAEKVFEEEIKATIIPEEKEALHITPQPPVSILSSEEEVSPSQVPRRELRRERKLNPKYASSEYTSIFNSKRTSFITKNMNHSPQKKISNPSLTNCSENISELLEEKSKENTLNDSISNQNIHKKAKHSKTVDSNLIMDSPVLSLNEAENFKVNKSDTDATKDLNSTSKPTGILQDDNPATKLTYNVKNSKNNISKEINPNGMKRKFDGTDKLVNKRLCRRDSVDSNSSRSVANENKPFNRENINKSVHSGIDSKNNLPKQKANGDVLSKIDCLRSSRPKSNCASDKN